MKRCVVKIYKNELRANGFFAYIPFNDKKKIQVLITCNHFINGEDISLEQEIKISKDNDSNIYDFKIDKSRKTYTNEVYDVTFIEIKEEEKNSFNSFLEIDDDIESLELMGKNQHIYLLHYLGSYPISYSLAELGNIGDNYCLKYKCSAGQGSCGCPILRLSNNKVIGIHIGCYSKLDEGIGTNIKYPIKDCISAFNKYNNTSN